MLFLRIYAEPFWNESPSSLSCLLYLAFFALVYHFGVRQSSHKIVVYSIQYLANVEVCFKIIRHKWKIKTGVSKRHMPNYIFGPSPRVHFHVSHVFSSLLLTTISAFVSRVTRLVTQHTLLEVWDEVQNSSAYERNWQTEIKHKHKSEAVPELQPRSADIFIKD